MQARAELVVIDAVADALGLGLPLADIGRHDQLVEAVGLVVAVVGLLCTVAGEEEEHAAALRRVTREAVEVVEDVRARRPLGFVIRPAREDGDVLVGHAQVLRQHIVHERRIVGGPHEPDGVLVERLAHARSERRVLRACDEQRMGRTGRLDTRRRRRRHVAPITTRRPGHEQPCEAQRDEHDEEQAKEAHHGPQV